MRTTASVFFIALAIAAVQSSTLKSNLVEWKITSEIRLPPAETTNWCTFHKGPEITKKHFVSIFDFVKPKEIAKDLAHHVDVYKCSAPLGVDPTQFFEKYVETNGYDCYNSSTYFPQEYCQAYLEWAFPGYDSTASNIKTREETHGFGNSVSPNEFFMLVTHYENPNKEKDLIIEAGMQFFLSDQPKKYESGHLLIGTEINVNHMIPPNTSDFVIPRHCSSECTKDLPHEINIVSYTFHTHGAGHTIRLRHFRDGQELPLITSIEKFDPFKTRQYLQLPEEVKVLPGDQLTLECAYNTSESHHGKVSFGGRSAQNEMCIAFLVYYPLTEELSQCGSSLSSRALYEFLGIEFTQTVSGIPVVTSPPELAGMTLMEVAEKKNWTPELLAQYQKLVNEGPNDGYCYGSHGRDKLIKNI